MPINVNIDVFMFDIDNLAETDNGPDTRGISVD